MLTADAIEKNFKVYFALCGKLGPRTAAVSRMLDEIGERLALAPASSRLKYHCAYPGGLVDHSLRVLQNVKSLNTTFKYDLSAESMIVASLFHDLGKVGDLSSDFYLVQDNTWRRENLGESYKVNETIQRMPTADRGLWILQHYGIVLTQDEWIAIRTNDGQYVEENSFYKMHEPSLALILQMADRIACDQEKRSSIVTQTSP